MDYTCQNCGREIFVGFSAVTPECEVCKLVPLGMTPSFLWEDEVYRILAERKDEFEATALRYIAAGKEWPQECTEELEAMKIIANLIEYRRKVRKT